MSLPIPLQYLSQVYILISNLTELISCIKTKFTHSSTVCQQYNELFDHLKLLSRFKTKQCEKKMNMYIYSNYTRHEIIKEEP